MRKLFKVQPFTVGQRITLMGCSEMALTYIYRLTVKSVVEEPSRVGYNQCKTRYGTVLQKGKRQSMYLDIVSGDTMVFDGWDIPFQTEIEAELGRFDMNACINLVGDHETIRDWADNKTLLPFGDHAKATILVMTNEDARRPYSPAEDTDDRKIILYPDLAEHRGHAVIDRIRQKRYANA